jgi:hypothetical protein
MIAVPRSELRGHTMASRRNALLHLGPRRPSAPLMQKHEQWVKEVAYYKAMDRRFTPGHELTDWLAAEQEVDELCRRLSDN